MVLPVPHPLSTPTAKEEFLTSVSFNFEANSDANLTRFLSFSLIFGHGNSRHVFFYYFLKSHLSVMRMEVFLMQVVVAPDKEDIGHGKEHNHASEVEIVVDRQEYHVERDGKL